MISIVIPVCDEEASLGPLHRELRTVCRTIDVPFQLIFVDDGSCDGSWAKICELADHDDNVQGIRFRRNFGKAAALTAGFASAGGDIIFTLDGDLQDDPAEIPHFLAALQKGFDVVSGWKRVRHDPWHKVLPSRVFNRLVSWVTGVRLHDHNCGMKCYRTKVIRDIHIYGELHRFIPVLAAARGFRVGEIAINHRARRFGRSKYGVRRFIKGFLDLLTVIFLTSFGERPQHCLGTLGLGAFFLGGLGMTYLAVTWLARLVDTTYFPTPLHDRPLLIYSVAALLLGAQMMSSGLIAELIADQRCRGQDNFSIQEKTASRPGRSDSVSEGDCEHVTTDKGDSQKGVPKEGLRVRVEEDERVSDLLA